MERLLHPDDKNLARKVARATFVTRLLIIVAILVGGACLVVLLQQGSSTNTAVQSVRTKQNTNAPVLTSIKGLAEEIRSCTDPSGACAKRGQEQQAEALSALHVDTRNIVAATVVCQRQGFSDFADLTTCVDRLLVANAKHRR